MKKLILYGVISMFISCGPDYQAVEPPLSLPLITQTGENTFGCYIDGALFVPRSRENVPFRSDNAVQFVSGTGTGSLSIELHNFRDLNGTIRMDIHFDQISSYPEGEYLIKQSNCEIGVSANNVLNFRLEKFDNNGQNYNYYCSIEDTGSMVILRRDGSFIAGTFEFKAVNENDPSDIIEITQGRFDFDKSTIGDKRFP